MSPRGEHVGKEFLSYVIKELRLERKSIIGLSRALHNNHNIVIDRLKLSGYLNALVDVGVLFHEYLRPAKVYSVLNECVADVTEQYCPVCGYRCRGKFSFHRDTSGAGCDGEMKRVNRLECYECGHLNDVHFHSDTFKCKHCGIGVDHEFKFHEESEELC